MGGESQQSATGQTYDVDDNAIITTWTRLSPDRSELEVLYLRKQAPMGYPAGWEQRQVYRWIATRRETLVSIHADSS